MQCLADLLYLKKPDADADPTDDSDVLLYLAAEDVQASLGVNLHGGLRDGEVEDLRATAGYGGETAGVRDVVGGGECDVDPVLVLLGAATVQLQ